MSTTLPVVEIFGQLQDTLNHHSRVVLQAPPGAGKSTLLPLLLMQSGNYGPSNQIIMLEPRRVAARQIARYLAQQLGEPVGQSIGLKMRGESKVSQNTVLTIVTDGVMVRHLQSDPELHDVGLLIFDEFHERALQTDLALALSLDAQELNESVNVLIMSATLDLDNLSTSLDAPIVKSEGRQFPVDVRYVPSDVYPKLEQIIGVIKRALSEHSSSVLVFLSGVSEIKRVQQHIEPFLDENTECFPLYGALSIEAQSLAIRPAKSGSRKLVLATNVAQTSLTIEGVDVVVDAGIEKVMVYQSKTASEKLVSQPVSIASSVQRMGRAGRLRPGVCYRMGTKQEFERRRQHDVAEIERVDLAQLLLEVSLWGAEFDQLFWATQPSASLLKAGQEKLQELGFWHKTKCTPTELARNYQNAATDLRLSRMLLLAKQRESQAPTENKGLVATACLVAGFLEEGGRQQEANLSLILSEPASYLIKALTPRVSRLYRQLMNASWSKADMVSDHLPLIFALAFPDRIGKKQGKRWKLSNGTAVDFHPDQIQPNTQMILVVDYSSSRHGQYIQSYLPLEVKELQELMPELFREQVAVGWSEVKSQPQKSRQTRIGQLMVQEQVLPLKFSDAEWQAIWLDYIRTKGLKAIGWNEQACETLRAKLALVTECLTEFDWPDWSELERLGSLDTWLAPYLHDVRNASQLKQLNLAEILLNELDWSLQQALQEACPSHYLTPAGNKAKIDYLGPQPKLSVKLQEMFGEPITPAICQGKRPLLIELLSPARRPLQVTQDLANFWQNAYQQVKKEMKGRYPKHPWPDDPVSSIATNKTKLQLSREKKN